MVFSLLPIVYSNLLAKFVGGVGLMKKYQV
jgi:hypothetical protein